MEEADIFTFSRIIRPRNQNLHDQHKNLRAKISTWGCGEIGIASDSHSEGTGIEAPQLHLFFVFFKIFYFYFFFFCIISTIFIFLFRDNKEGQDRKKILLNIG